MKGLFISYKIIFLYTNHGVVKCLQPPLKLLEKNNVRKTVTMKALAVCKTSTNHSITLGKGEKLCV